jgi:hypothetical protein
MKMKMGFQINQERYSLLAKYYKALEKGEPFNKAVSYKETYNKHDISPQHAYRGFSYILSGFEKLPKEIKQQYFTEWGYTPVDKTPIENLENAQKASLRLITAERFSLITNEGINNAVKNLYKKIVDDIDLIPKTPEYAYLITQLYARAEGVLKLAIDKHHKSPAYLKSMLKMKEEMEIEATTKEVKLVKKDEEAKINEDFEETEEEMQEETEAENE